MSKASESDGGCGSPMATMQVLAMGNHYYVKSVREILRCDRSTSEFSIVEHRDLAELEDLQLLGDIYGLFGKVHCEGVSHLLVIADCAVVANVRSVPIFRITKLCALPLVVGARILATSRSPLDPTPLPQPTSLPASSSVDNGLARLKNRQRRLVKFVADKVKDVQQAPRLVDELLRLVNNSGHFYFSKRVDLTSNMQRRSSTPTPEADPDFFWNRGLLDAFFNEEGHPKEEFREWILPTIYGFIDQSTITFDATADIAATFTLISRRSTRMAGVRYLRRGVDESGDTANFVETEFIMSSFGHCLSFVQIRGSVPICWSQSGYQFRPPISMDRPIEESMPCLRLHFEKLAKKYQHPVVIVNLLDQGGREAQLGDSYQQHMVRLNSAGEVFYHAFDFHRHYGSVGFKAVHDFVVSIQHHLTEIGFCWIDRTGQMVKQQKGVIRTNCADCLDRTNVVQSTISQAVSFTQAQKLGLVEPIEEGLPESLSRLIKGMWTANGDSISKQYAGTNALKRDMLRSGGGQRKLMGVVKDGYNSASRYYLSQMRDAHRQRVVDTLVAGTDANLGKDPLTQLPQGAIPSAVFYENEAEEPEEDEEEEEDEKGNGVGGVDEEYREAKDLMEL